MTPLHPEKESILELLINVIDPELGIDIVNLGLIYSVDCDNTNIQILMTMTTPACPMHGYLLKQTENIINQHYPWMNVSVKLVWDPPWDPSMMSEKAKQLFNR
jgi:metal-sulfur cluster biosynthetic enzyme